MAHPPDNSAWVSASRETANLVVAVALLGFGIVFLIGAVRLDFGSVTLPGPGMFPTLAAALLALLAAVMAAQRVRSVRQRSGTRIGIGHRNSILAAGLLLVMAGVFETLGTTLAAFAFLALLAAVLTGQSWWKAVLFAAALTIVVVLVFERLLEVSLPAGMLRLF